MRLALACTRPGRRRCARRRRPAPRRSNRRPMRAGSTSSQGIAKGGFDTGRVDVGICGAAAGGGTVPAATRWSTSSTSYRDGRGGAVDRPPNRRGVRAVHATRRLRDLLRRCGRDRELPARLGALQRWHRRHGRSLLGRPFSKRFPNERWANVGGDRAAAFLLRMMERRTAKCARAGFDAVEYDVVAAHESGSQGDRLATCPTRPARLQPRPGADRPPPRARGRAQERPRARSRSWIATSTSRSTRSASPTTSAAC